MPAATGFSGHYLDYSCEKVKYKFKEICGKLKKRFGFLRFPTDQVAC